MRRVTAMPVRTPVAAANRLLADLPRQERHHVLANCEPVELALADLLYQPGERMHHVYFPIGSFVALLTPIDRRASLAVGLIGSEGMLGIPLMLGANVSALQAVVHGAGPALRMTAALFRRELGHGTALQRGLNRYLHVWISQLALSAACTRFHVVEARLARWLLMANDRAGANDFHVTHEVLGHMLGARRAGVTKAASSLQRQTLISYRRGDITILDRGGLEAASCGCYRIIRDTYESVMGTDMGSRPGDARRAPLRTDWAAPGVAVPSNA